MKPERCLLGLLFFFVLLPSWAIASDYDGIEKIIVFGDSLSDQRNKACLDGLAGNIFTAQESDPISISESGVAITDLTRNSNGPLAVEVLASILGTASLAPSLHVTPSGNLPGSDGLATTFDQSDCDRLVQGIGTNYAVARSTAAGGRPEQDLLAQVIAFLNDASQGVHGDLQPSKTLYIIFTGSNDVLTAGNAQIRITNRFGRRLAKLIIDIATENIQASIAGLELLVGARHFLVVNVPDISKIPIINSESERVQAVFQSLTRRFNRTLARKLRRSDIIPFDLYTAFNDVLERRNTLGITNSGDACLRVRDVTGNIREFEPAGCEGDLRDLDQTFAANDTPFHEKLRNNNLDSSAGFTDDFTDQFIFIDNLHPTGKLHQLLGECLVLGDECEFLQPGN